MTTTAAGVLADAANGGLRRDLSLAFELSDAEFTKTEFGGGVDLPATATENGSLSLKMLAPINGRSIRVSPSSIEPRRRVTFAGRRGGPYATTIASINR